LRARVHGRNKITVFQRLYCLTPAGRPDHCTLCETRKVAARIGKIQFAVIVAIFRRRGFIRKTVLHLFGAGIQSSDIDQKNRCFAGSDVRRRRPDQRPSLQHSFRHPAGHRTDPFVKTVCPKVALICLAPFLGISSTDSKYGSRAFTGHSSGLDARLSYP